MSLNDLFKGLLGAITPATHVVTAADGSRHLIVRSDHSAIDLRNLDDQRMARPLRIRQDINLREPDALAGYVDRFVTPDTVAFSDAEGGRVIAVFDYHTSNSSAAGWTGNRATFTANIHPRYALWRAADGVLMDQMEFGAFLENRAADVAQPDAASLLEAVMDFTSNRISKISSRQRLADGSINLVVVDEDDKSGTVRIPEKLLISVPIYEGMIAVDVLVRMRWRITPQGVKFGIEIHDRNVMERDAFALATVDLIDRLSELGVPTYESHEAPSPRSL